MINRRHFLFGGGALTAAAVMGVTSSFFSRKADRSAVLHEWTGNDIRADCVIVQRET